MDSAFAYCAHAQPRSQKTSHAICEGYMKIRKNRKRSLKWSDRYLVLSGSKVFVYHSRLEMKTCQDTCDEWDIVRAEILKAAVQNGGESMVAASPRSSCSLCLILESVNGMQYVVKAPNRADYAKWVTACYRFRDSIEFDRKEEEFSIGSGQMMKNFMDSESDIAETASDLSDDCKECTLHEKKSMRHVSFMEQVRVRQVPRVEEEFHADVYYTAKDVERFMNQSRSILSRTEQVMYRAITSLKQKPRIKKLSHAS